MIISAKSASEAKFIGRAIGIAEHISARQIGQTQYQIFPTPKPMPSPQCQLMTIQQYRQAISSGTITNSSGFALPILNQVSIQWDVKYYPWNLHTLPLSTTHVEYYPHRQAT